MSRSSDCGAPSPRPTLVPDTRSAPPSRPRGPRPRSTPEQIARRRAVEEQRQRTFRRRRIVAGTLVALLVVSITLGIVRLFDNSTVGVAEGETFADPVASQSSSRGSSLPPNASTSGTPSTKPRPTVAVPAGTGKFTAFAVPGTDTVGAAKQMTYTVEVENGLGADGAGLARTTQQVLQDPRGWQRAHSVRFVHLTAQQVKDGKKPDVVVTFAAPKTVDKLCAPLPTNGKTSCANRPRAILNYWRWVNGVEYFGTNLTAYRQYLINHEVGHLLGFLHQTCGSKGKPAPLMSQQTLGLGGCTPNAWPDRQPEQTAAR